MKAQRAPSDNAFDRVELVRPSGTVESLSRREFEAMELDDRVRALLGKKVRFYSGGAEIPVRVALSSSS